MPGRVLLEVCIESVADAKAAEAGGADRLELNSALSLGGLTPSLGTLIEVRAATRLPVIFMARPRGGGFCYDAQDFRVLRRDAELALTNGADGIAFGVLSASGHVDIHRCRELVRDVGPATAVFHRAFDCTPDLCMAIEYLAECGVRRVMTSGGKRSAAEGAGVIQDLIARVADRVEVLPAGGIRPWNVRDLLARTGCDQVHAALTAPAEAEPSAKTPPLQIGPPRSRTSASLVAQMRQALSEPGKRGVSPV